MLQLVFWLAAAILAYTWILFPALVLLRGLLFRRPYAAADITPSVSLVIAAHNEAGAIEARLENATSLDYPRDRLEVFVASDGSTDATDDLVRRYADQGVKLLALPRGGKIPTLNAAVPAISGEVLIFSDANTTFAPDAVRKLVRPLADSHVGGVAGNQLYLKNRHGRLSADGERVFWNFDRRLKQCESIAGNTVSATGGIYAIRRSLFRPIPLGVTDDFVASTAVIAQGYRLVFAADALAYEPLAEAGSAEFSRKVRVITQGFRSLSVMRELFNPLRHGFYAVQLFSHKLLRRLSVIPLLVLSLTAPFLWRVGLLYQLAVGIEVAFYVSAILGTVLRGTRLGKLAVLAVPFYFALVNAAALVAIVKALRGDRVELWKPDRRGSPLELSAHVAAVSKKGGASG